MIRSFNCDSSNVCLSSYLSIFCYLPIREVRELNSILLVLLNAGRATHARKGNHQRAQEKVRRAAGKFFNHVETRQFLSGRSSQSGEQKRAKQDFFLKLLEIVY